MQSVTRIPLLVCVLLMLARLATAANAPAKAPTNVILITLDTVRADHLGCYGNKNIQTPTLDALGHDGIVFERAISQVPLTWPSHAAILTGMYPFQNGVQDFTGQPLDPRFRAVAQAFKQHGYATGAVVSAFVLDRSWGLARGFDFYDDAFAPEAFVGRDIGLVDRRAGESVDHALAWLKKNQSRPFFFWLHLYDPHSPYDPPEPFRSQYHDHPYDGEIAYADHELGRLIAWLKQTRLYDSSLIVFLSDHGESLGEHGEHEHGFFVYNATVHIPLIVKPAAGSGIRPGRTVRPVETTAVAKTLLEAGGIRDGMGQQLQSRSLLDARTAPDDAAYSETFYPFSSFGWSPLHALETSRYHYIEAPQPELYDLDSDPGEKNNIAPQQAATTAVLKDKLKAILANHPNVPEGGNNSQLSPDALDKLRALGYVAYRSPVPPDVMAAGLPDPKSKLAEFNSILEAEDALQRHNDDQADALLRKVQEQDPNIYIIPFLLGETAIRNEKWAEAADQLQRCLKLNPNFDNAMTGLARAQAKLGHTDEAKIWLQKAVSLNPQNYRAWYESGLLDASSNPAAALSAYQKAVAVQPNFYPGQRELGMALFNHKDYAAAAPHVEKAISLGMEDAHLHNYLGICYSRTNRLEKAVRSYQAALRLDPGLAEAHLNLAFALQRMQKSTAAETEYKTACRLDEKLCQFVPHQ
jgi:arylsulfatase A-like enzyme/Flp pilus assembly protein TadD